MDTLNKIKNINSVITISIITSVLYYCGYLSAEYHNKILGISVNYNPIEYLKWGGDFFIYSFIDFFSNLDLLFSFSILHVLFYIGLVFYIFLLTKGFRFKKIQNKLNSIRKYFFIIYTLVLLIFGVYYLRYFVNNDLNSDFINYSCFEDYQFLFKRYFIFLACNTLCLFFLYKTEWNSNLLKKIAFFLIGLSILILPCLYGVYGRSYEYPYIEDRKSILIGEDSDNYITVSLKELKNGNYKKEYIILPKDSISYKYIEKYNFFNFIDITIE